MKKTGRVLLSLIMTMSLLLSACSGKTGSDASGETSTRDGAVRLSVLAPQNEAIEKLQTNRFSKYIEEKLDIQFAWETTPGGAYNDKKQLVLASGDYPAVILDAGVSKADQIKYGKIGAFIPLNDLIEQHAPNIKKALAEVDGLKEAATSPDGNIYAIPKINECLHCTYNQRVWINTVWLDKLGLDMPTTTDEFYEVLKAFKEKDPNGNGKADEVPFTTTPDEWGGGVDAFLMNAFIYNDASKYLSVKDGKVIYSAAQPEWREGLEYLHRLYQEGLIDKGAFTQNGDAVKQLANKPDSSVGVVGYAIITGGVKYPRNKDYAVLPPLKGPNGVQLAGYSAGIRQSDFVITNKATEEEKIAAIRLADYLYSEEGTILTSYGFEGDGWKKAESSQLDYNGQQAKYDVLPPASQTNGSVTLADTWWQLGTMQMLNSIRESFVAPEDPLAEGDGPREYRFWLAAKEYEPFTNLDVVYPGSVNFKPEDALTISQIERTLTDYVDSSMAQFITGNKDISKDWDSYIGGFKGLQLEKYLKVHQDAYDEWRASQ
ncbi:ABC transporter substrate-binding protein [Paenibacillus sp. OK003]|uniref:ABC transporter substrate-binding protein n=1 Tax=Paenibacillus sp. OK003 TaxID=1884380 RepID=UPI000B8972D8|nr:ABC transporter substrate-binding protein [Paenibacillus sp. OK003]